MATELFKYNEKRDFTKTSEPEGRPESSEGGLRFVVQHHIARRDHYDFRIEWDGALLSWAVPKGPSYDTKDKRLAVEVEPHPLEYRHFEGTIPKGEYGGGTVMLWDEGTWEPQFENVEEMLEKGNLKMILHGRRLKGKWALVRLKPKAGERDTNWLLLKEKDEYARDEDGVSEYTTSIRTGRTMAEIEAGAGEQFARNPFDAVSVQLAKLVRDVPSGGSWVYELKYDGYRIAAFVEGNRARLMTRNGHDYTHRFPAVAAALSDFAAGRAMVLDGEMVVTDAEGKTDFQALQGYLKDPQGKTPVYIVFDLLALDGADLRGKTLIERKEKLRTLMEKAPSALQYSRHVEGSGAQCFAAACEMGMEGVVGKRKDSVYSGTRNGDWVKLKCDRRQELVIGGYTRTEKKAEGVSALLLGAYENGRLVYCGRAGSGIGEAEAREILARAAPLVTYAPPFINPPKARRGEEITWLQPSLAAEVKFAEWTEENLLRQASFKGLRLDKNPREIIMERSDMPEDMPLEDAADAEAPDVGAGDALSIGEALSGGAIAGNGVKAPSVGADTAESAEATPPTGAAGADDAEIAQSASASATGAAEVRPVYAAAGLRTVKTAGVVAEAETSAGTTPPADVAAAAAVPSVGPDAAVSGKTTSPTGEGAALNTAKAPSLGTDTAAGAEAITRVGFPPAGADDAEIAPPASAAVATPVNDAEKAPSTGGALEATPASAAVIAPAKDAEKTPATGAGGAEKSPTAGGAGVMGAGAAPPTDAYGENAPPTDAAASGTKTEAASGAGAMSLNKRTKPPALSPAARAGDKLVIEGVTISHPDKVIFTDPMVTKGDVVRYYAAVAPRMLPYVEKRILSIVRCPKGVAGACFYKKHPGTSSKGVITVPVTNSEGETEEYFYIDSVQGLVSEAQMGTLEFHTWGSRVETLEQPDVMVFDLDPDEGMDIGQVRQGVLDLKSILDELSLQSYLKTSGGKGYHVVVPLRPSGTWKAFNDFARRVAEVMEQKWPERYTSNMRKVKRTGRIFIDWVRNGRGATSVAPYSIRARQGAKVSMPISWEELDSVAPDGVGMAQALERIAGRDPWQGFFGQNQLLK